MAKNKKAPEKTAAEKAADKKAEVRKARQQAMATTRAGIRAAPTTADAGAAKASVSVNRHFEAAKIKGVWYVRSKHTAGAWGLANYTTSQVCKDLEDGRDVSADRLRIVV